jgi:hypothetical protein
MKIFFIILILLGFYYLLYYVLFIAVFHDLEGNLIIIDLFSADILNIDLFIRRVLICLTIFLKSFQKILKIFFAVIFYLQIHR